MRRLVYEAIELERREGESVLDALLRQGVESPFSCRRGSCQVCLARVEQGEIPPAATRGLSAELRRAGYFLPCVAVPAGDLVMRRRRDEDLFGCGRVESKDWLSPRVCRLRIDAGPGFFFRAGQFVHLRRPDGLTRSYSLAGLPEDYFLELHVERRENGEMSRWIADVLEEGDEVAIRGPLGEAVYGAASPTQPHLLVASGTGLAPLLGIARAALAAGHRGPIELFHGGRDASALYLGDELAALAGRHPNFRLTWCVTEGGPSSAFLGGSVEDAAFERHPNLVGWRVHLAGAPSMVERAELRARRSGADPRDIVADPFDSRDLRRRPRERDAAREPASEPAERPDPPPDPELWAALGGAEGLRAILESFYARVYEDSRLAPFFHGVTRQRAIDKQFSFLREVLTGDRVYFGERPRSAHHWMVISDELFDYRESLFMSCVERAGIARHWIERWRRLHEHYRRDLVKRAPFAKRFGGVELPLDGFGEEVMPVGALCDACGGEVAVGERVRYHLRLGTLFCSACAQGRRGGPFTTHANSGS